MSMKKYLKRPDYESDDINIIEATESVELDLDSMSLDDVMNAPDDTYFSCDSIEEFHDFLKKWGLY